MQLLRVHMESSELSLPAEWHTVLEGTEGSILLEASPKPHDTG